MALTKKGFGNSVIDYLSSYPSFFAYSAHVFYELESAICDSAELIRRFSYQFQKHTILNQSQLCNTVIFETGIKCLHEFSAFLN